MNNSSRLKSKNAYSVNKLIDSLYASIIQLLSTCDKSRVDRDSSKYVVQLNNPASENMVRCLLEILSNNTRKPFWKKERTPFDVVKGLKVRLIDNIVKQFETSYICQYMNDENSSNNISFLFFQYLLNQDLFLSVVQELLMHELYLSEIYNNNALIVSKSFRGELLGVLSMLEQFKFVYTPENKTSAIISYISSVTTPTSIHPILQIKESVRVIVKYYFEQSKKLKATEIECIGDESKGSEIGTLIRKVLCTSLLNILNHGFKKSYFGASHVWHLIEDISKLKKTYVSDIGGIILPTVVMFVNNITEKRMVKVNCVEDINFENFVCFALNKGQLSQLIRSIIREQELINRYYDTSAILFNQAMQNRLINLLSKLDNLPFNLNAAR
jgi:hypothetical protein